jgi:hypothetical protein
MTYRRPEEVALRRREIAELHRAGWKPQELQRLLSISSRVLFHDLNAMGITRPSTPIEEIPGEEWSPLPGWPFTVSSFGRIKGKTNVLLIPHGKPGHRRRVCLTRYRSPGDQERLTADLAAVVWCAFGRGDDLKLLPTFANGDSGDIRLSNLRAPERGQWQTPDFPWTEEDDDALRRAPTRRLAVKGSRHTSHHTIQRIRHLGLRWPVLGARPPELEDPDNYKERLYQDCRRLAPIYLSPADREDVAGSAFLAIMERRARYPKEAVELARKSQGRMFNRWRDTSVDAPIPGTDGLTYLDRLAAGEDGLHMP